MCLAMFSTGKPALNVQTSAGHAVAFRDDRKKAEAQKQVADDQRQAQQQQRAAAEAAAASGAAPLPLELPPIPEGWRPGDPIPLPEGLAGALMAGAGVPTMPTAVAAAGAAATFANLARGPPGRRDASLRDRSWRPCFVPHWVPSVGNGVLWDTHACQSWQSLRSPPRHRRRSIRQDHVIACTLVCCGQRPSQPCTID